MQRLLMAKKFLSSCHWNRRGVFFLLEQRMVLVMGQFVIGDVFFLFSSLLPRKSHSPFKDFRVVLLFIEISTSVLILLISNFYFWSFCKILICF
jgi:hypothetical protein